MRERYPARGCYGNALCPVCPKFKCSRCKKQRPWCHGASDERPSWCDTCWEDAYQKRHAAPPEGTTGDRPPKAVEP